jgi:hypothetical protein
LNQKYETLEEGCKKTYSQSEFNEVTLEKKGAIIHYCHQDVRPWKSNGGYGGYLYRDWWKYAKNHLYLTKYVYNLMKLIELQS